MRQPTFFVIALASRKCELIASCTVACCMMHATILQPCVLQHCCMFCALRVATLLHVLQPCVLQHCCRFCVSHGLHVPYCSVSRWCLLRAVPRALWVHGGGARVHQVQHGDLTLSGATSMRCARNPQLTTRNTQHATHTLATRNLHRGMQPRLAPPLSCTRSRRAHHAARTMHRRNTHPSRVFAGVCRRRLPQRGKLRSAVTAVLSPLAARAQWRAVRRHHGDFLFVATWTDTRRSECNG